MHLQLKVDPNSNLVLLSPFLFSLFSLLFFFFLLSFFPSCLFFLLSSFFSFLFGFLFCRTWVFFCKMPLFLSLVNYAELFLRTVLNKRSSNGNFV